MGTETIEMITYQAKDTQTTTVKIDGKAAGTILESKRGFRYFPKGFAEGGDFFPTLDECKRSLEQEG